MTLQAHVRLGVKAAEILRPPNKLGQDALFRAVQRRHETAWKYLCELYAKHKVDHRPDFLHGRTALHVAAELRYGGPVDTLLKLGVDHGARDVFGNTWKKYWPPNEEQYSQFWNCATVDVEARLSNFSLGKV